jgi:hypothetical protein
MRQSLQPESFVIYYDQHNNNYDCDLKGSGSPCKFEDGKGADLNFYIFI